MKRAIIIAQGRVQRVGYRDLVADWAMELGVVGYVENQPDGTVKIVAEGEEEILVEFVRKAQPEDDPLIRVMQVDVEYERATGEFEFFEIKRGNSEEETAERLDTAAKSLKALIKTTAMMNENLGNKIDAGKEEISSIIKSGNEMLAGKQDETISIIKAGNEMLAGKQDQMLSKQDVMIEKQDETISIIKSGVDDLHEFRTETHQNFADLDRKYGKIAASIERILDELKEERKGYRESIEKLVKAIIESGKGGCEAKKGREGKTLTNRSCR
jgi:acylphosphatase